jgi:hypothetical protein
MLTNVQETKSRKQQLRPVTIRRLKKELSQVQTLEANGTLQVTAATIENGKHLLAIISS